MQRLINAIKEFFGSQPMDNESDSTRSSLHNSHVFEYLDYYLDLPHAPHYGVLLDGPWGIGKTYLIKRYLRQRFGEYKERHVYVSLFGLKTLSEIDDALYASAHPFLTLKGMKVAGKLAKALMKYNKVDVDFDFNIKDFLSKRSGNLFIFDDVERANMDVNEILGYINEFIEHDGCKVIIIANEGEIKDQNEYARRKEKIIGKTLKVASSIDEALSQFISEIESKNVRHVLLKSKDDIARIYDLSKLHNLRILQQSLWDFERLYSAFSEKHRQNESAIKACLLVFMPLSMAFKAGVINADDILDRQDNPFLLMKSETENEDNKIKIHQLQKRYQGINLSNPVLSNDALEGLLSRGILLSSEIQKCLDNSVYFATSSDEPSWKTVWYFPERSEEEFKQALETMEEQFRKREFLEPGVILHVFGLRIWLASKEFISSSREEVVEEGKKYIDDLFDAERLAPVSDRDSFTRRLHGYDGLGIQEVKSKEFSELNQYLSKKRSEASERQLPAEAQYVLNLVTHDQNKFHKQVCQPSTEDGEENYYHKEVMKKIEPDDFVSSLLTLHPLRQKRILLDLCARYANGHLERKLPNEVAWVKAVKGSIQKAMRTKSPPEAHRLETLIEWYIQPILEPNKEQE